MIGHVMLALSYWLGLCHVESVIDSIVIMINLVALHHQRCTDSCQKISKAVGNGLLN